MTDEGRTAAALATLVAALMIAQQVAGKAIRDSLFLSLFPAESLPLVMGASAVVSLVVVLAFTRLVVRLSPARVVPILFVIHGGLYLVEWAVARTNAEAAAVAVYIHSTAVGATVVSGFWSVLNERFDPHSAKKLFARVASGATAGGVIGGVVAWQVGQVLPLSSMLLVLVAVNVCCALLLTRVRTTGAGALPPEASVSGLGVMRDVPYLRHVAMLVIAATLVEACVDYVFKAQAKSTFDVAHLITFFAIFHAVVASGTFALQAGIAKRSLERLGLTGTIATHPGTNLLGGIIALVVPGLWPLVALRGASMAVENSLYRSGYELLYTPLVPEKKRPTKTVIDVGASRVGALVGSAIALVVIAVVPAHVSYVLLGIAVIGSLFGLILSSLLHDGYVSALADSLRQGWIRLEPDAVPDATTRQTLADTAMAIDREKLLEEIAVLRGVSDSGSSFTQIGAVADVSDLPAELASGDPVRVRAALRSGLELPRDSVRTVIELLADDELHDGAIKMLRRVADKRIGQLIDVLLDPDTDFAIRRRLPRVLGHCRGQRAISGLLLGLADDHFEVRYRCGLALYHVARRTPSVEIPAETIYTACKVEFERGESVWRAQTLEDASLDEGSHPFSSTAENIDRCLEHVFTLLSSVLEQEPLQLAYRALASDDKSLRGTGLEYLENVLPEEVRDALWPHLGVGRSRRDQSRPSPAVVSDLIKSMSSMTIDIDLVRKEVAKRDKGDD